MNQIFPDSKNLKQIIERHELTLYDVTIPPSRRNPLTWEEIEIKEPAQYYEAFHQYQLLPTPKRGKRLRDLFFKSHSEAFFPVLRIPHSYRENIFYTIAKDAYFDQSAGYYFLNELHFEANGLLTVCHPSIYPPYSSSVTLPNTSIVKIFADCFTKVQFTGEGAKFKKTLMGRAN